MICIRCKKETNTTIMSRFNTDILCKECENKERKHPLYKEAVRVEREHCLRGDYNFEGIGKPVDL